MINWRSDKQKSELMGTAWGLTTALSWVEGGCPGCPEASTLISQPLDSKTLPSLAIPATQPWAPTHRDIRAPASHCDNSGKRKRKEEKTKGGEEGRQKTKRTLPLKKNKHLKKNKGSNMLFPTWLQIATTRRLHNPCEPVQVCLRLLTAKQPLHPGPRWTGKPASLCC